VERPGRHRPLVRADTGREVVLHQVAPAPADSERPHVDARASGQRGERALAEGPDAGGQAEQRRRIERDAQARRRCAPGRVEAAQVVIAPSMERIAPVT
jgi:hypothetical protein